MLRLDATYEEAVGGAGWLHLRLVNCGLQTWRGFRLAVTTVVGIAAGEDTRLTDRVGGYHELQPLANVTLGPGDVWRPARLPCAWPLRHANDGPSSAFLIADDGMTVPIRLGATARVEVRAAPPTGLRLEGTGDAAAAAWGEVESLQRRLHPSGQPFESSAGRPVELRVDPSLAQEHYTIEVDAESTTATAGSQVALQWALLAIIEADGVGQGSEGRYAPRHEWRGLHIDLARQFVPADDVARLIDVVASLRLNRLHLHLTDDEAWRIDVIGYPGLVERAAWRGPGRPVPPLLGSGDAIYGGAYSAEQIRRWVDQARRLGVVLVPEIDLPGHSFAALAAQPELVDPDDRSDARSIQGYVRNTLNPGVPGTWPFLEAVVGTVTELFPGPYLHIGGDEVPEGAWTASPLAQQWAQRHGCASDTRSIHRAFMQQVVHELVVPAGRRAGLWQDVADGDGRSTDLDLGDAYLVAWQRVEDARLLASRGWSVVAAPGARYYLDMAASADWWAPGMGWAGSVSPDVVTAFDPTDGWTEADRQRLLGVQACLWSEHLHDHATLQRMLRPRLDLIAERCWRHTPL